LIILIIFEQFEIFQNFDYFPPKIKPEIFSRSNCTSEAWLERAYQGTSENLIYNLLSRL